jgi:hypothetical protein
MPQVRITSNTVVNRKNVRVGDVVGVSESDARLLVAIGKAEPVGHQDTKVAAVLKSAARHGERARRPSTTHEVQT